MASINLSGTTPPSLYRRLLGADFDRLPPVLRAFHDRTDGGTATGSVTVDPPAGPLAALAARAARLPVAGVDLPLRLRVVPEAGGERWRRWLGDRRMATRQWLEGPYLVEQMGPLRVVMAVDVTPTGMVFRSVAMRVAGVPLLAGLRPAVDAVVEAQADGWVSRVTVSAPGVGRLTHYEATVRPEP